MLVVLLGKEELFWWESLGQKMLSSRDHLALLKEKPQEALRNGEVLIVAVLRNLN